MKFTIDELIKATGATILKNALKEETTFTPSTDTRTIKKGEIYLPLKGENFDGEDFIDKALEAGAEGYFTSKETSSHVSRLTSHLILQVDDTLTAYLQLTNFYKKKINPKTIAITGSSGKTTTKEMAYCVASEKFKTHKSELNFNNEIGVCKTILSMPEDTEVLILEMGMRGLGEIELLSKYSEPDIAIIANVGSAHIGRLGSIENIAKAKCEIVKHLKNGGILIAHDDDLIRGEEAKRRRGVEDKINNHTSTHLRILSSKTIYFSLANTKILEQSIGYSKFEYKNHEYELNIEGDYNIQNSLAVIELGLILGMNEDEIASGLKKYSPIEKRWDVQEIKGYKIINDSYNANPESMKAAIETFITLYSPPLLLVLGDMAELGQDAVKYHREIGDFLAEKLCHCEHSAEKTIKYRFQEVETIQENGLPRRCDAPPRNDMNDFSYKPEHLPPPRNDVFVITVGKLADEITQKLNDNGIVSKNFDNNSATSRYILDNIKFGTTIILKASRSMKFEEIIDKVSSET